MAGLKLNVSSDGMKFIVIIMKGMLTAHFLLTPYQLSLSVNPLDDI